jgi:hypothetical protein
MPHERNVGVSVRVDMDLAPELADLWKQRLLSILVDHIGDETGEDWNAHTATLSALVARGFDRQFSPFAELHAIIDEHDEWTEDFVWFGKALDQGPEFEIAVAFKLRVRTDDLERQIALAMRLAKSITDDDLIGVTDTVIHPDATVIFPPEEEPHD